MRMLRAEAVYRYDTRNLDRTERQRYSNFLWNAVRLNMGPKVKLIDLVGESGGKALDMAREDDLRTSLDFYSKRDSGELVKVLRFFSAYVMQQARQAKDLRRQIVLAFKAVDLLRMIVQHSRYSVSYDAETIVGGVFVDLGSQLSQRFARYHETEMRIHALMRRLHHTPNDHSARAQLADGYAQQTSLYDAFVQYQVLLRLLPAMRLELDRRRGLVHVRIGDLFQGLADLSPTKLQDGRKLRNFIDRYNRDHAGSQARIPMLSGPDSAGVRRVQRSFRRLADQAYSMAIRVPGLEPHVLLSAHTKLGSNLLTEGQYKQAAAVLTEGNRYYKPAQETPAILNQRLNYLDLLLEAANRSHRRELANSVLTQIDATKQRYRTLNEAHAEKQKRQAEMLAGEGQS
ncbi:MAG: hypothetical protein ACHQZQ_01745 [SAR324 cluster bacterium]